MSEICLGRFAAGHLADALGLVAIEGLCARHPIGLELLHSAILRVIERRCPRIAPDDSRGEGDGNRRKNQGAEKAHTGNANAGCVPFRAGGS